MTEARVGLPSSWAEVCVLKPRLRQQAKEAGYLSEWRTLAAAAESGADTLEAWRELCARIAEHGSWYGTYAIRDDAEDEDPVYRCPSARRCERRTVPDRPGEVPVCHLSGAPMTGSAHGG